LAILEETLLISTKSSPPHRKQLSPCLNSVKVWPQLFFVVAHDGDSWEQISIGLKTYEEAEVFRKDDFCKNRAAFIVCTVSPAKD